VRAAARAGLAAAAALAVVYAATAAPAVTFWDAGEFVAAFATFGVPHPPGTPLYVCIGRAWTLLFGVLGVGAAASAALLSAACTAAAGGVTAALLTRWTGSTRAGVAAALTAGTMSTVWGSATEPEVYAPALLLALLAVLAADLAGRAPRRPRRVSPPRAVDGRRHAAAAVYAIALSAPLHLSALVCAPVVVWLAAVRSGNARSAAALIRWRRGAVIALAAMATAGLGTARPAVWVPALGLILLVAARRDSGPERREAAAAVALTVLATSGVLVLLLRARHDPWLNQGAPGTWTALADVLARSSTRRLGRGPCTRPPPPRRSRSGTPASSSRRSRRSACPHPPGTPLYVCIGRAWTLLFGVLGIGAAASAALLSAACTAARGGVTAALLARWTGSARAGVAAALTAGTMSTAWGSATEPEVYAPALLLALLAVLAADRAGGSRGPARKAVRPPEADGGRHAAAAVYALALSAPLHLSALVCAPVVAWLAAVRPGAMRPGRATVRWRRGAVVALGAAAAAGLGTARPAVSVAAVALLSWVVARRESGSARREAAAAIALTVLAAAACSCYWCARGTTRGSTRARRHVDGAGRRARSDAVRAGRPVATPGPGVASDRQPVRVGRLAGRARTRRRRGPRLAPHAGDRTLRALGALGAPVALAADRRSAVAWGLLLACGTLGVAAYLNLKAGPSFGVGVLPDAARTRRASATTSSRSAGGRGARGRARRRHRGPASVSDRAGARDAGAGAGAGARALPGALNWRAADRRREPPATADAFARALLGAAPPRALLVRAPTTTRTALGGPGPGSAAT
jgi:hypothetical protein